MPLKNTRANKSNNGSSPARNASSPFPIIGIGAPAGGLKAFEAFFKAMPEDEGITSILVVHFDPFHVSILPAVFGLADQLKQVMLNLLNNASYACKDGGTITLTKKAKEGKVAVQVEDNGCVLSDKDRARSSSRFLRPNRIRKVPVWDCP